MKTKKLWLATDITTDSEGREEVVNAEFVCIPSNIITKTINWVKRSPSTSIWPNISWRLLNLLGIFKCHVCYGEETEERCKNCCGLGWEVRDETFDSSGNKRRDGDDGSE